MRAGVFLLMLGATLRVTAQEDGAVTDPLTPLSDTDSAAFNQAYEAFVVDQAQRAPGGVTSVDPVHPLAQIDSVGFQQASAAYLLQRNAARAAQDLGPVDPVHPLVEPSDLAMMSSAKSYAEALMQSNERLGGLKDPVTPLVDTSSESFQAAAAQYQAATAVSARQSAPVPGDSPPP